MYTRVIFIYYILITSLFLLFSCKSRQVIHHTEYNGSEEMKRVILDFSRILHVNEDSLYNYSLYRSIDKWGSVKDSLSIEAIGYNQLFIQYIYYLNYNLEMPNGYDDIYNWKNTYLYRNTDYLKEGDLIFFKENHRPFKQLGFYLTNKYFVSAMPSGKLEYYHLTDTINSIELLSNAKILIDATKQ